MIRNGEEAKKVLAKMYSNTGLLTQRNIIADCFYSLYEKDSIFLCKKKIKLKICQQDLKETSRRTICERIWENLFTENYCF